MLNWTSGRSTPTSASGCPDRQDVPRADRGTDFDRAPLAHGLSAAAAAVYVFITYTLVRGG
ncbi:hypothetical protein ACWDR0_33850, partial [Streptomyces sp. NPDC003691]